MRILGIDPGLHLTGYAIVDAKRFKPTLVEAGVIRLNPRMDAAKRLVELHTQVGELLREFTIDQMGVEQLYAHYKHPRTAILMGHARGVILLAAAQAGISITHLPSTLVKKMVTGNGHAGKLQIQKSVMMLCHLAKPPTPADTADAIAIAWVLAGRLIRLAV
jgi:crossover junction endodeoxyribonuclease RuvC